MRFDAGWLVSRASETAGYDDFGAGGWREGLDRLVDALNGNPFPEEAASRIEATLLGTLVSRLEIEAWIAKHPEIEQAPIERPVIILGLPRTASTALQNNLAADPHWRFLRGWEAESPVPPPSPVGEANDSRFLAEKAFLERDETYKGKHIQAVGGPVEDTALLRLSFGGQEQGWPVFDYTRWWRDRTLTDAFAYQARAMRLLQSRQPPRRWMIKSPWYSFHLDDLRTVYRDAALVMTHRRPTRLIASTASLLAIRYRSFLPAHGVDPKAIGRFVLDHWSIGIARAMEHRRRRGDSVFFDVHHEAFNADPLGVLKSLYAWAGAEMTADAEHRLAAWAEQNRRGAHGTHDYGAEEFGFDEGEIEERFADYIRTFDLRG